MSSWQVEPASDEHEAGTATSEVVPEQNPALPKSHADDYVVSEPDTVDNAEDIESVEVIEVTETEVGFIDARDIVVEEPVTEGRRTEVCVCVRL